MKLSIFILKAFCIALCVMTPICAPSNCAYASKEELLDLEEEKSNIEGRIEEGWAPVFCRLLVGGCVVYWLVCKYGLNKQEQEQEKLGKEQPAAHCFLANILFGNYRLPIKIYYICRCEVDN